MCLDQNHRKRCLDRTAAKSVSIGTSAKGVSIGTAAKSVSVGTGPPDTKMVSAGPGFLTQKVGLWNRHPCHPRHCLDAFCRRPWNCPDACCRHPWHYPDAFWRHPWRCLMHFVGIDGTALRLSVDQYGSTKEPRSRCSSSNLGVSIGTAFVPKGASIGIEKCEKGV